MSEKKSSNDISDDDYDEISDEDYGFVIGPDGELKSVFLPVVYDPDVPENVRKIFKILGINDIDNLNGGGTLH